MEYSFRDAPFRVYGMPYFDEDGTSKRLKKEMAERMFYGVRDWGLDVRSPGARVAFRTDSASIRVTIEMATISPDVGISLYGAQSGNLYIGRGENARYAGLIVPRKCYEEPVAEGSFTKQPVMEDIMIFLPRNEAVKEVTISLDDGAKVEAPTPYRYPDPVIFYGSSITEGASVCKTANAYSSLLSRALDFDFINYGLSGSGLGELFVADHLAALKKSVFVMDYDYNAPDEAHLRKTHEPFFLRMREKNPDVPIILITGPRTEPDLPWVRERVEIIRTTYENALKRGDDRVYFIEGAYFWGDTPWERYNCTADNIHPNDLGMHRMAEAIRPTLEKALKQAYGEK